MNKSSMKKLPHILALSALLGLATTVSTQAAGPHSRGPHGRGPGGPGHAHGLRLISVLDNDQDREISGTELANAPSNILSLDINADGSVTGDELHPARPADAPRPRPEADGQRPVPPLMLALDADGDGDLSSAEIANATASLTALDLDGDGRLTGDEFLPEPPEDRTGPPSRRGGHRRDLPSAG